MSPVQMVDRCPGVKAIGVATLRDWKFRINVYGTANIVPKTGAVVFGVVWRCSADHFHTLDKYEGVARRHYFRRAVIVETDGHDALPAITYAMPKRHRGRSRVNYMMTAVLPGARAHGLPDDYLAELDGWLPRVPIGEKRRRYRGVRR